MRQAVDDAMREHSGEQEARALQLAILAWEAYAILDRDDDRAAKCAALDVLAHRELR